MAGLDSTSILSKKLVQGLESPPPRTQCKAIRFFSGFLCKAAFFALFVGLLPYFPSQAPDFVNRTIITKSWELLHLILVGMAVSYGLFGCQNVDRVAEKEVPYKFDSPQSYMSHLLQVSSVFDDDEAESPSGFDENEVRMWNSQYIREESAVVVMPNGSSNSSGSSKPLLLPVRNLKSLFSENQSIHPSEGIDLNSGSGIGSVSASNGMKEVGKLGKVADLDTLNLKEETEERIVLPSPIPWRSRSGRMEVKDESGTLTPPSCFLPPPAIESDLGTFKSSSFRSPTTRSDSTIPSPKKLSPAPSFSSEMRANTGEDSRRKKSFSKSSPPAPPPPPSPPLGHKSTPNLDKNGVKRSFKDAELKDFSRSEGREDLMSSHGLGTDASILDMKLKNHIEVPSLGKSVRTIRPKDVAQGMVADEKRMVWSVQSSEKPIGERSQSPPTSTNKYQTETKNEFATKCISSSDGSDSDDTLKGSDVGDDRVSSVEAKMDENEVDKKAEEFIAKVREQIRLQRIELIKNSSGQSSIRNPK